MRLRVATVIALVFVWLLTGCGGAMVAPRDPLVLARQSAEGSADGEVVGRWLLLELVAPGGLPTSALAARKALDQLKNARGLYASVARGIDDESHGRLRSATDHYLAAIDAARVDDGPEAALFGWFATSHLLRMRASVPDLWKRAEKTIVAALDHPGHLGFRPRGELAELSVGLRDRIDDKRFDELAERVGCVKSLRIAGPFGERSPRDPLTRFPAESPGVWPSVFPAPLEGRPARVLKTKRRGCVVRADEPSAPGVHYIETFVTTEREEDVIIAVQSAWSVLVDDHEVLNRDIDRWGAWPRFGVALRLSAGRHRIVARLGAAESSIRLMKLDGTAASFTASDDPGPGYALRTPQILENPNVLDPFLRSVGVPIVPAGPSAARVDVDDPALRYLAADLAFIDGEADIASVIMEPLVKDTARATGTVLAAQATFVERDPIFSPTDARDLALDLRVRATDKDSLLWYPRLWLLLDAADKKGLAETLPNLSLLTDEFQDVGMVAKALATAYSRLGYKPEFERTIELAAKRFPDDPDVLRSVLTLHDEYGRTAEADRIVERLQRLEPDGALLLERALQKSDFDGAIAALRKLKLVRPDDADIVQRIDDLLVRSGRKKETLALFERALEVDASNVRSHISLMDARFAEGDSRALRKALANAIEQGVDTDELRQAVELVEGMTELEPFRGDGLQAIRDFEKSGAAQAALDRSKRQDERAGNAERVLDYATLWIHADGSARMLEHEILHMQSREAIAEHAEQKLPQGVLLKIRTVKRDGTIFEPEIVGGKPTATMPHLEVGDYIETETIYALRGDGTRGRFVGPRWFFREAKIDYFRSEFVVVASKDLKLDVETTGEVPAPVTTEDGPVVIRRYRVDKSPAVPEEPFSTPMQEFYPSLRVGFGINQANTLERLVDVATNVTPADPRLRRIAETIAADGAKGKNTASKDEKARRIYRWVLANVDPDRESDPRRSVTSKRGSRAEAFRYLCRLVGVEVVPALVSDRLSPPPRGPMSEAEVFSQFAVAITTGPKQQRWMIIGDKFTPYGFLPSALRSQPAVFLVPGLPRVTTPAEGTEDGVTHQGDIVLDRDGSATLKLDQSYRGRLAIELRGALEQVPEARLKDAIETHLLPSALPGARLKDIKLKNVDNLDEPLVLSMDIELSGFAVVRGDELVISPPFVPNLAPLITLSKRETPLAVVEGMALNAKVELKVTLPSGASLVTKPEPTTFQEFGGSFSVKDREADGKLVLDRYAFVPAGRVTPKDYPAFVRFVQKLGDAFERELVIKLDSQKPR